jgi:pimeloyl-ACP methyl ester carboxylesterase
MESAGANTEYRLIPQAGHLVHDDAPRDYRRAVEDFLSALAEHT